MARVRFGDVVKEIKINIDRATDNHEFYIAGEHMETENIHLTKRGRFEGSDVGPAFIRLFRPGQVLYGSRRTYLKKVAVADFEGITSNTTFVLETKDQSVMMQELLPFIMLTDSFTEYAIRNSKGSTNPYILFSDLCAYEFELPAIEKQHILATRLLACDNVKEAYKRLLTATDELVKSQFVEMFGDKQSGFKYPCSKVQELTDVCSGGTPDRNNAEYWEGGTIPWVKTTELQNNVINIVDEHITEKGLADSSAKLVPAGSILIAMYGQGKTRGMTAYLGIEASTNQACACILPTEKIDMVFMWQYFVNSYNELRNLAKGSNQANLNAGMIKSFPVPVPPIELQKQYSAFVAQADKSKFAAQQALADLTATQKALMRQYLG